MINDAIPGPIADVLALACDEQAVRRAIGPADGTENVSELQLAFLAGVMGGLDSASRYLGSVVDDLQQHGFRGSHD